MTDILVHTEAGVLTLQFKTGVLHKSLSKEKLPALDWRALDAFFYPISTLMVSLAPLVATAPTAAHCTV